MEGFIIMAGLEGKRVIVFYDDFGSVSRKDGVVTDDNNLQIELNSNLVIPRARIVRIEVLDNEH